MTCRTANDFKGCGYPSEEHRKDTASWEGFTAWNMAVINTMYCVPEYCQGYCAGRVRCSAPEVERSLNLNRHWEETGEDLVELNSEEYQIFYSTWSIR